MPPPHGEVMVALSLPRFWQTHCSQPSSYHLADSLPLLWEHLLCQFTKPKLSIIWLKNTHKIMIFLFRNLDKHLIEKQDKQPLSPVCCKDKKPRMRYFFAFYNLWINGSVLYSVNGLPTKQPCGLNNGEVSSEEPTCRIATISKVWRRPRIFCG